jgi:hypothetical protein
VRLDDTEPNSGVLRPRPLLSNGTVAKITAAYAKLVTDTANKADERAQQIIASVPTDSPSSWAIGISIVSRALYRSQASKFPSVAFQLISIFHLKAYLLSRLRGKESLFPST